MQYELRRSKRARTLRLTVHPDGAVVLTAPYFSGLAAIERFLTRHSAWVREKVEATKGRDVIRIARGDIPMLKRRALELARERAAHFANLYGVSIGRISIRAQKARWGSCSENGDLSFNYKIAVLPARIADYIVAHEISHRVHFDHSKDFWQAVSRTFPEHKDIRKELKNIVTIFR